MIHSYFIRDEATPTPLIRRILIIFMVIVLVAGIFFGLLIESGNRKPGQLLDLFGQLVQSSQYDEAIGIYRQAQEKAMSGGFLNRSQALYQEALISMENIAGQKLAEIENTLLRQEQLDVSMVAFADGMAELSSIPLTAFLRGLCADYLAGKIDRPMMESAFSQLASLSNLKDAVGDLPLEFDRMTAAQSNMISAAKALESGNYWEAYNLIELIISDEQYAGFVKQQADRMQEACRDAMYEPLLESALELMEGGRYISAVAALEKLSNVFANDPVIQSKIEDCQIFIPKELAGYKGPIEVIVIKPLIVNPAQAFDGDAYAAAADESMITTSEFKNMLEQLYQNNFILIDSSSIYNDSRELVTLRLPPGKKPLILVIEGLNYYATRRETGNCWDLVLDEGGEVSAEYPDEYGNMTIDREGEAIGILDVFVGQHPDFSLDGAKGTISLTGYECIFGKITDVDQLDDRNLALQSNGMPAVSLTEAEIGQNRKEAQAVINRLKMTGWLFASSTYGFIDARNHSMERIQTDTEKWKEQVGSLTGPVSMLNYPNGSYIPGSDERAVWLKEQGFILFSGLAGMGQTAYLFIGTDYLYIDKTPVNGVTLRSSTAYKLDRLFDASKVYDHTARGD